MEPTLHKPYKINERVSYDVGAGQNLKGTGTIIGIATGGIVFTYIVLLDKPLTIPGYEDWKAVTIPGGCLTSLPVEDGSNWLDNERCRCGKIGGC